MKITYFQEDSLAKILKLKNPFFLLRIFGGDGEDERLQISQIIEYGIMGISAEIISAVKTG